MPILRNDARAILSPEDVAELVVKPIETASIPGRCATTISMSGPSLRVPRVAADPSAAWVEEGAEIAASTAVFDEITAESKKVAGLVVISRELAEDSSPSAAEEVGRGLTRDISRQVDRAFVGDLAAPAVKGLASLTTATTVAAGSGWTSVDPMIDAIAASASVGGNITNWLVSASDYTALRKVKVASGSNQQLLAADAGGGVQIEGRQVIVSPDLEAGTVWGIDSSRVIFAIREGAEVIADSSVYFSSDRVAVRATMRLTWAFPHPESIVRIVTTP